MKKDINSKMDKRVEQALAKQTIQVAKSKQTKHKKASPTLETRKMQIKTTVLHHCTPTKTAKIKGTMQSVSENMSNWNMVIYCWWRVNSVNLENHLASSIKCTNMHILQPSNFTPRPSTDMCAVLTKLICVYINNPDQKNMCDNRTVR